MTNYNYQDFVQDLATMKEKGLGLMSGNQYNQIGFVLNTLAPCNLLVFGLGEDSYLWNKLNHNGKTVFLEDSEEWIGKFDKNLLDIRKAKYTTLAKDHNDINFDENKLKMDLDEDIENISWDMIVVDAPLGHGPPGRPYKGPGRMQSIYEGHRLLRVGGICVIDDIGREIEQKYLLHYFGERSIINVVEEKVCFLKKEMV